MIRKMFAVVVAFFTMLAMALVGAPVQAAPASFVPIISPATASDNEPVPPQRNLAWEAAAKSTNTKAWQKQDKGFPDKSGKFKVEKLTKNYAKHPGVVAPAPPSGVPVHRYYHIVKEDLVSGNVGAAMDMTVADPYLNYASDYHGLMEMSLQDVNGNVVEIGWTVNPSLCPSEPAGTAPCLFIFHWETGDPQCYNGCGFVTNPTATYKPGDLLPNPNDSSGLNWRLLKTATAIHAGVGDPTDPNYWVGYWPLDLFDVTVDPTSDSTAPYGQPTLTQMFTETASVEAPGAGHNTTTACSDSGNGNFATSPNGGSTAARILNVKVLTGTGSTSVFASPSWDNQPSTVPSGAGGVWPMQTPATYNFRLGGGGFKGNNTLPGVSGFCG